MQNWVFEWVNFSKFSQIWAKIGSNLKFGKMGDFAKNWADWYMKLVVVWVYDQILQRHVPAKTKLEYPSPPDTYPLTPHLHKTLHKRNNSQFAIVYNQVTRHFLINVGLINVGLHCSVVVNSSTLWRKSTTQQQQKKVILTNAILVSELSHPSLSGEIKVVCNNPLGKI